MYMNLQTYKLCHSEYIQLKDKQEIRRGRGTQATHWLHPWVGHYCKQNLFLICMELFSAGATFSLTVTPAAATVPIHLDNVACIGSEVTLASCPHPAFGVHNCAHSEDVGVTCQALVSKFQFPSSLFCIPTLLLIFQELF